MWDAKVGQKVVCIRGISTTHPIVPAIVGQIYTILRIETCELEAGGETLGFQFEELPLEQLMFSRKYNKYCPISWPKDWFRPLNSIEKGMEVLRGITLNPKAKVSGFEQPKVKRKVKANVHSTKNPS